MECTIRQIDMSGLGRTESSAVNSKQDTRQKDFLSMLLKNQTREEPAAELVEPPVVDSEDAENKDNTEDVTQQGLHNIVTLLQNHVNEANTFLNLKFPLSSSQETHQSLVPLNMIMEDQTEQLQTLQISGEDLTAKELVPQESNSLEGKQEHVVRKQEELLLHQVKSETVAPVEEKQEKAILPLESEVAADVKTDETKQPIKSETQKTTVVDDTLSAEKNIASVSQEFTNEMPVQKLDIVNGKETVTVPANNAQELVKNLSEQILLKATGKENEFEVQLEPMNLGKLAIKVAYGEEGTTVSIICTTEKALKLLTTGARNVAMIMEAHLDTPTTIIVEESQENYLEQHKEQSNQRQQQQEQQNQTKSKHDETIDFMQQLRLGLVAGMN